MRWYQWDPSKWLIALLQRVGLARDLKRISSYRILEARLAAENLRLQDSLKKTIDFTYLPRMLEALNIRYSKLKENLVQWEAVSKEYQTMVCEQVIGCSRVLKETYLKRLVQARQQFKRIHDEWTKLTGRQPLDLQRILLNAVST